MVVHGVLRATSTRNIRDLDVGHEPNLAWGVTKKARSAKQFRASCVKAVLFRLESTSTHEIRDKDYLLGKEKIREANKWKYLDVTNLKVGDTFFNCRGHKSVIVSWLASENRLDFLQSTKNGVYVSTFEALRLWIDSWAKEDVFVLEVWRHKAIISSSKERCIL